MKNTVINMLSAIAALTAFTACSESHHEPDSGKWEYTETINLTRGEEETLQKINEFGHRLMVEAGNFTEDGEFCVSPVSMSLYLGAVANITTGDCQTEILRAFETDDLPELNSLARKLMQYLPNDNHGSSVAICNGMWVNKNNRVQEEAALTLSEYYNIGIEKVDLSKKSTLDDINKWLSRHTKGLSPLQFNNSVLGLNPPMISANTVYFKGEWTEVFDRGRTDTGIFHGAAGDIETHFMHADLTADYAENEYVKYLALSFKGNCDRMDFFLPKKNVSIPDLTERLDENYISDLRTQAKTCNVIASIPKFEVNSTSDINCILENLGMQSLGAADLSPLGASRGNVGLAQGACLKIDEKGAELAVVTLTDTDIFNPGQKETVTFTLDRPFLYHLRNNRTGAILIGGAVVKF